MGKYNSSLTRVVPVFDQLYNRDKAGISWLPKLLKFPSGGNSVVLPNNCDFTIEEVGWGAQEKRLEPPVSLLSWLIRHPREPLYGNLSSDPVKAQKRRDLIDGSTDRLVEALSLLRSNPKHEDWHIFEGISQPDAFIVTPSLIVVIEGKRTEAETTKKTKWMDGRHQMLRHIDCAWEIRGRRQIIGFLIVEGDAAQQNVPNFWQDEAKRTLAASAIRSSLPHRGPEEQKEIAGCFVGVTTWQCICATVGLKWPPSP